MFDDGSTDGTSEVARLAGATVLRHEGNYGKGSAMRAVLAEAKSRRFDAIVFLDGDGQHDPVEIPRLVDGVAQRI